MTRKELADAIALCQRVASAAERAAHEAGREREFEALAACIERQEKEHRRLGRRLVGPGATRGRFSVGKARDYFIAKVLADGYCVYRCGALQIDALVGVREDYVRGAILMADVRFGSTVMHRLGGDAVAEVIFEQVKNLDYAAMVEVS